jgi:hypothetical protein
MQAGDPIFSEMTVRPRWVKRSSEPVMRMMWVMEAVMKNHPKLSSRASPA